MDTLLNLQAVLPFAVAVALAGITVFIKMYAKDQKKRSYSFPPPPGERNLEEYKKSKMNSKDTLPQHVNKLLTQRHVLLKCGKEIGGWEKEITIWRDSLPKEFHDMFNQAYESIEFTKKIEELADELFWIYRKRNQSELPQRLEELRNFVITDGLEFPESIMELRKRVSHIEFMTLEQKPTREMLEEIRDGLPKTVKVKYDEKKATMKGEENVVDILEGLVDEWVEEFRVNSRRALLNGISCNPRDRKYFAFRRKPRCPLGNNCEMWYIYDMRRWGKTETVMKTMFRDSSDGARRRC